MPELRRDIPEGPSEALSGGRLADTEPVIFEMAARFLSKLEEGELVYFNYKWTQEDVFQVTLRAHEIIRNNAG